MRIWLTRHGQTNLNQAHLMQGRSDEPLNETGIAQAEEMRAKLIQAYPDLHFDSVYASPLGRAIKTASIIGGVPEDQIIIDPRLIEADFGKYEKRPYGRMGLRMTLYWALPEVFPAPPTVETVASMVGRSRSFLSELESKEQDSGKENILITCHAGIIRSLSGYLSDRKNGILWRPKPQNCEIRIWDVKDGTHTFAGIILP